VDACRTAFGGLDILVNGAGGVLYGPAESLTAE
jgi:NAD(P)-dependent dehydrogenase (short-subunit alcohol dehydrogenase family)